jgi:predicted acylesterase/phospholipase RssA
MVSSVLGLLLSTAYAQSLDPLPGALEPPPEAIARPLEPLADALYYGTADLQGSGMAPHLVERPFLQKLMERTTDPDPQRSVVVAANGGGLRAANYTTGIMLGLSAIQASNDATLLESVDAWSSVSGGNYPILQYVSRLHNTEDAPSIASPYAVARAAPSPAALSAHLQTLRANFDIEALGRWHPRRMTKVLDKHLGVDRALTLKDLEEDDRLPGWVPNSVLAPSGQLIPLTTHSAWLRKDRAGTSQCRWRGGPSTHFPANLAAMASSAVPGAIPPVPACVASALIDEKRDEATEAWLIDGAWTDRMGLATALDLATVLPEQNERVVLAIDSRPQPQVNRTLPNGMRWDSFAAAFGHNFVRKLKRRVQLIGTGLELMRYRADQLLMGTDFGDAPSEPVSSVQRQVLRQEQYSRCDHFYTTSDAARSCDPERFGREGVHQVARYPEDPTAEVHPLRLGTDLLLQPESWHLAARGFDDERQDQCERTAARLFTVLAIQPTDLSLGGAYLMDEADVAHEDGSRLMYPSSNHARDTPERQAAIVTAGVLSVFLYADSLHEHLAPETTPYLENNFQERFVELLGPSFAEVIPINFRSAPQAADWEGCTQLPFPTSPKGEGDQVNDNCEDRSRETDDLDTSVVDRSHPLCADHPRPKPRKGRKQDHHGRHVNHARPGGDTPRRRSFSLLCPPRTLHAPRHRPPRP